MDNFKRTNFNVSNVNIKYVNSTNTPASIDTSKINTIKKETVEKEETSNLSIKTAKFFRWVSDLLNDTVSSANDFGSEVSNIVSETSKDEDVAGATKTHIVTKAFSAIGDWIEGIFDTMITIDAQSEYVENQYNKEDDNISKFVVKQFVGEEQAEQYYINKENEANDYNEQMYLSTMKIVAKDYSDEALNKILDGHNITVDGKEITIREYINEYSAMDDDGKVAQTVYSVSRMIPNIIVSILTSGSGKAIQEATKFLTIFASTNGTTTEQLLNQISEEDWNLENVSPQVRYSFLSSLLEAGTETISFELLGEIGGFTIPKSLIGQSVSEPIIELIKNYGKAVVGEEGEELISYLLDPLIKNIAGIEGNMSEEYKAMFDNPEELAEIIAQTAITTTIMQIGSASIEGGVKASNELNKYASSLNQNDLYNYVSMLTEEQATALSKAADNPKLLEYWKENHIETLEVENTETNEVSNENKVDAKVETEEIETLDVEENDDTTKENKVEVNVENEEVEVLDVEEHADSKEISVANEEVQAIVNGETLTTIENRLNERTYTKRDIKIKTGKVVTEYETEILNTWNKNNPDKQYSSFNKLNDGLSKLEYKNLIVEFEKNGGSSVVSDFNSLYGTNYSNLNDIQNDSNFNEFVINRCNAKTLQNIKNNRSNIVDNFSDNLKNEIVKWNEKYGTKYDSFETLKTNNPDYGTTIFNDFRGNETFEKEVFEWYQNDAIEWNLYSYKVNLDKVSVSDVSKIPSNWLVKKGITDVSILTDEQKSEILTDYNFENIDSKWLKENCKNLSDDKADTVTKYRRYLLGQIELMPEEYKNSTNVINSNLKELYENGNLKDGIAPSDVYSLIREDVAQDCYLSDDIITDWKSKVFSEGNVVTIDGKNYLKAYAVQNGNGKGFTTFGGAIGAPDGMFAFNLTNFKEMISKIRVDSIAGDLGSMLGGVKLENNSIILFEQLVPVEDVEMSYGSLSTAYYGYFNPGGNTACTDVSLDFSAVEFIVPQDQYFDKGSGNTVCLYALNEDGTYIDDEANDKKLKTFIDEARNTYSPK